MFSRCPIAGALQVLPEYPVYQTGNNRQFVKLSEGTKREERNHPVLLLWAVPAVIVVGGAGYWLVHMH
jgi:hypothetical protein